MKMFNVFNGDSNIAQFFADKIDYVKTKIYEKRYPQFKARTLIPLDDEAPAGADTVSYEFYEGFGLAKIISDYANLARGEVKASKHTATVKSLALAFDYHIQDIRKAQMSGVNLEAVKGNNIKRAFMMAEDKIAFLGDLANGLYGLFTHPNITKMTLPADGTGSSTTLLSKTSTQIVRDLNAIVIKSIELTQGVEAPNTLLMTAALKGELGARMVDGTAVSVLDYFLKQSEYIEAIETVEHCKVAGTGDSEIICAYHRDEDHLGLIVPQDFEMFDGQEKGLSIEVPCHQRIGGTMVRYPLSVTVCEGVN